MASSSSSNAFSLVASDLVDQLANQDIDNLRLSQFLKDAEQSNCWDSLHTYRHDEALTIFVPEAYLSDSEDMHLALWLSDDVSDFLWMVAMSSVALSLMLVMC